jgi:hypothetical protein
VRATAPGTATSTTMPVLDRQCMYQQDLKPTLREDQAEPELTA